MLDFNVRDAFYESFRKSGKLAEVEKQAEERGKEIGTEIGKEIGTKIGTEIGTKIGTEIGKEENARENAFEMLKRNFDAKDVAAILKKPIEWVQSLKDSTTANPST